jgi:predicted Zn-ribbon and HTH transcriptional regulator
MKPRDWFGVGIRLFGVWTLLMCLEDVRTIIDILIHVFNPTRTPLIAYIIHAIVDGMAGLYLLSGAQFICNIAFPQLKANQCRSCGYDLTGNTSGTCPECGTKASDKPEQE